MWANLDIVNVDVYICAAAKTANVSIGWDE